MEAPHENPADDTKYTVPPPGPVSPTTQLPPWAHERIVVVGATVDVVVGARVVVATVDVVLVARVVATFVVAVRTVVVVIARTVVVVAFTVVAVTVRTLPPKARTGLT